MLVRNLLLFALLLPHVILPTMKLKASSLSITTPRNNNNQCNTMNMRISKAMELTKLSDSNITAAKDACKLWDFILNEKDDKNIINNNNNIRMLSHALYASSLIRIGKELEAIHEYETALSLSSSSSTTDGMDKRQRVDWMIGKAQAYQRLLQYSNAKREFIKAIKIADYSDDRGLSGAITCFLRMGDVNGALDIIDDYYNGNSTSGKDMYMSNEVKGMLGLLQYLTSEIFTNDTFPLLDTASKDNLLLYQWTNDAIISSIDNHSQQRQTDYNSTLIQDNIKTNVNERFLELIKINTSPFDEHTLIYLDDKVHLHQLLTQGNSEGINTSYFWPLGHVLTDKKNYDLLFYNNSDHDNESNFNSSLWMLKQRSGYGSHGNNILTLSEEQQLLMQNKTRNFDSHNNRVFTMTNRENGSYTEYNAHLLQKMIHPSLLINNRKFSLRVYIVYFSINDIYVSTQGLVKLASSPYEENSNGSSYQDNKQDQQSSSLYMTNSGREMNMIQKDFEFLKDIFHRYDDDNDNNDNLSYSNFWMNIKSSVRSIFKCYNQTILSQQQQQKENLFNNNYNNNSKDSVITKKLETLYIPKIMGFDYVVDTLKNPWLVEINRFPGLEPRDESDEQVKSKVVLDAWLCAAAIRDKKNSNVINDHIGQKDGINAKCVDNGSCFTSLEKL